MQVPVLCDSWLTLQSVTIVDPIQFSLRTSARRSYGVVKSEKGEMIPKKGILTSSSKSVIKNPRFARDKLWRSWYILLLDSQ